MLAMQSCRCLIRHIVGNRTRTTALRLISSSVSPTSYVIGDQAFIQDNVSNTTQHILGKVGRNLYRQSQHPLNILSRRIVNHIQCVVSPTFADIDNLSPVVTPKQNFDDLLFPIDHPGRKPQDTYYLNRHHLLRTHTSAHQSSLLAQNVTDFVVTADVYRRDEIDSSHYPVFHQMEGFRSFKRSNLPRSLKESEQIVAVHTSTNPLQPCHTSEDALFVARNLKMCMESIVEYLFRPADPHLQLRWVDAYFPFTSPSWELEILFQGKWLEVAGCGVVQQHILNSTGHSDKIAWAFGAGLERLAMILFDISDIRLFWSNDHRFLTQFSNVEPLKNTSLVKFRPFSSYAGCYKDIAFWLPGNDNGGKAFHDNDLFDLVRGVAGDLVESVALVDAFTHKSTGRQSRCYRITYRSMERNLTNDEINETQEKVRELLPATFGVKLR